MLHTFFIRLAWREPSCEAETAGERLVRATNTKRRGRRRFGITGA
jgi:hypothetical protein